MKLKGGTYRFVHVQKDELLGDGMLSISRACWITGLGVGQLPVYCAHCVGMKTISETTQGETHTELITGWFTSMINSVISLGGSW